MNDLTFETTEQNFKAQVLDSTLPVLVEFTADWCPPCKMLAPILNQIAEIHQSKLRVGMVDSDVHTELVQQYSVMGLPTMILFVGGTPVERITGYMPRERIEAKLLPHLTTEKA